MATYTNILFPAFQLASGRWIKIDMSRQSVKPTIGAPYQGTQETMEINPWAWGGIPEIADAASPEAGFMAADSCEFTFHNVAIKPSVDDTSLYDVFVAQKPEEYVWNLRMWLSAGTTNTFAAAPSYWWIIEAAEIDGAMHPGNPSWETYKLSARNAIAIGERVPVKLWLDGTNGTNGYLQHSVYDTQPIRIEIDGTILPSILCADKDGKNATWIDLNSTSTRMFRLVDVLFSISDSMGITRPINDIAAGNGLVGSSWEYISINSPNPNPTETSGSFDDLFVMGSIYRSDGNVMTHDQKWTFFDNEQCSPISAYSCGNVLEVLKRMIVPHGLVARVAINASGQRYLEIREVELDEETTADSSEILEGLEIEAGDKAALGMRVVTANNGEIASDAAGGESIDNPYTGASRIRTGARWWHITHGVPDFKTDDVSGLNSALFMILGGVAVNVFKVKVKRDGNAGVTDRSGGTNPGNGSICYPQITNPVEAGSVMGKAVAAYYYNGIADPETDPVGIYRRYTKKLTWRESGLKDSVRVGATRIVNGQPWVIRRRVLNLSQDYTEFSGEKGTYDA